MLPRARVIGSGSSAIDSAKPTAIRVTGFPGIAPSTADHVGDDRFQLLQRRNWGGDLIEQRTLNFNSGAARNGPGYRLIRGEAARNADHKWNVGRSLGSWSPGFSHAVEGKQLLRVAE